MKKVWVIQTNFVQDGEEKMNDVSVFSVKQTAEQEFGNFVFLCKIKSEALGYKVFLEEKTAFESYIENDVNNNHIFLKLVEKNLID